MRVFLGHASIYCIIVSHDAVTRNGEGHASVNDSHRNTGAIDTGAPHLVGANYLSEMSGRRPVASDPCDAIFINCLDTAVCLQSGHVFCRNGRSDSINNG